MMMSASGSSYQNQTWSKHMALSCSYFIKFYVFIICVYNIIIVSLITIYFQKITSVEKSGPSCFRCNVPVPKFTNRIKATPIDTTKGSSFIPLCIKRNPIQLQAYQSSIQTAGRVCNPGQQHLGFVLYKVPFPADFCWLNDNTQICLKWPLLFSNKKLTKRYSYMWNHRLNQLM